MKRKILIILILLTTLSVVFSATEHCWRQDIARVKNSYSSNVGFNESSGAWTTSTLYDYVVQPGTTYIFNGLTPHTWECDNGATGDHRDFGAIWDRQTGTIMKTNAGSGMSGPQQESDRGCVRNNGVLCYLDGDHYYPAKDSCNDGGNIGKGDQTNISYTFTTADIGEHKMTAEVGAVSPTANNPYNSRIMYIAIPKATKTIYVGTPSMLVFGPEQEIITGTYTENGDITLVLLYTVMNRSFFDNRIVDYNVTCSSEISCIADNTYKNNWPVKEEQELTIPVTVTIPNDLAPREFAINLELDFSADDIDDCDPNADGNYCHTQATPTIIQHGLLDQQDFQIKSIDETDSDNCVGLDGVVGVTGPEYAPKVNLTFGNGTDPLIDISECDEKDINKNPNPNGVYCSQLEFAVELAQKIDAIAELREDIQELESLGRYSQAQLLRDEENKYNNFTSYLREQDLTNMTTSVDDLNINDLFIQATGLEKWGSDKNRQKELLKELYKPSGVDFVQTKMGIEVDETTIEAGLYSVRIDMNELGEITTSDYLFNSNVLNPTIGITVTVQKQSPPELDWFFYQEGYEDDFEEVFRARDAATTPNALGTNVENRGEIIKFDEATDDISNASFYKTYAYPMLVLVEGDLNGDSNTQIKSNDVGNQPNLSFENSDILSYWSGIGSSKGDGCETTSTTTKTNHLPYRVPDMGIASDLFNFSDIGHNLTKVIPNSKLLMSTVFYLPYSQGSNRTLDLETNMNTYMDTNSCTSPPCVLAIKESMSNYKVNDLNGVFSGINNSNICVYQEIGIRQENKWSIFWNESEILKDLNNQIYDINGITICGE